MTKSNGSFPGLDLSAFADLKKFYEQFKAPGFDSSLFLELQRKNLEAIQNANRIAFEGLQAVARRQGELLRDAMVGFSRLTQDAVTQGSPEEQLARQVESTREIFTAALANLRELTEMGSKSSAEAVEILNERFVSGLEELSQELRKDSGGGKTHRR